MSTDGNIWSWLFSGKLQSFGAVASIVGLIGFLVSGSDIAAYLALVAIILFLAATFHKFYSTVDTFIKQQHPDEFEDIATFVRYSTDDGLHYKFDLYKYVQSKRIRITKYEHGFNWTGSTEPEIESGLQEVGDVTKTSRGNYDDLNLYFDRPVLYNQAEVIHVLMRLNDSDGAASPHLEMRVEEPIRVIHWRVELRHKPSEYEESAILKKKLIDSNTSRRYETIDKVRFDSESMSYRIRMMRPEPGYFYRLEWEK